MTKLLIVDDSALMRKCLRDIFEGDGKFEILTARNGRDALAQIELHNPDVVTLDINMPEMDGLTCLSEIMTKFPRPVVMVSSITTKGAQATLEALELGAVDYRGKAGRHGFAQYRHGQPGTDCQGRSRRQIETAAHARPRAARSARRREPRQSPVRAVPSEGVAGSW